MLHIFSHKAHEVDTNGKLVRMYHLLNSEEISIQCGGQNNVLLYCPVKKTQPLLDMKHTLNFIEFLTKILSLKNA
jgi:hypothetical protein